MTALIHNFLYFYVLVPLLSILAFILSPFIPKVRQGLKARNWGLGRSYPEIDKNKKVVWFHCSSGEIEYAKSVIRELKKNENVFVLVTWHSPSAIKLAKSTPDIDLAIASPWEMHSSYKKFINHFKPTVLLVSRTDVWPGMLKATKKHGIPSILFSATFVKTSARYRSGWMRSFYSWAHNYFNEIYCVSEDDKQNFLDLNFKGKIEVTGDARYEQVLWRLENSKPPLNIVQNEKNILIAGSTWEEDENVLLDAWLKNRDKYRLIIAPHEPSARHIDALLNFAEKNQCKYQLLSQTHEFDSDLLIIDRVGVLASLYSEADIAFIGGAFKGSIHSVMEGLGAGLVCLFGPHHKNNREAIEFQEYNYNGLNFCNAFEDAASLSGFLQINSKNITNQELKQVILEKVKSKMGTAAILKTTVENYL